MSKGLFVLFPAMCLLTGCVTLPWPPPPPAPPPPPVTTKADAPRPPVTADQIHSGNARQMADALREELDRDAQTSEQKPLSDKHP